MDTARRWIAEARSVVVLTGAGVSAESGVPTFRGPGGLWRERRPEQLASPEAFNRDPKFVWEWYDWRRTVLKDVQPNPAHFAIAELERKKDGFLLVTQNVDGLHDKAGSQKAVKLHGDIWTLRCLTCGVARRDERAPLPQVPPHCECGGMLRPGVVWFGEALPGEAWQRAEAATRSAELVIVVGTSAVVYPAAGLVPLAKACGARVIECNMEETPYSAGLDRSFRGKAGELLPALIG